MYPIKCCFHSFTDRMRQYRNRSHQKPFPEFEGVDFEGNTMNNDIFKDYDATVINFWTNGCGSCIAEMPELEDYFQNFKDRKINLIGVAASAGESDESKTTSETILKEKGVTYSNLIPDNKSSFYTDFIGDIACYPITYIVDSEGNMIGGSADRGGEKAGR